MYKRKESKFWWYRFIRSASKERNWEIDRSGKRIIFFFSLSFLLFFESNNRKNWKPCSSRSAILNIKELLFPSFESLAAFKGTNVIRNAFAVYFLLFDRKSSHKNRNSISYLPNFYVFEIINRIIKFLIRFRFDSLRVINIIASRAD